MLVPYEVVGYTKGAPVAAGHPSLTTMHMGDAIMAYRYIRASYKTCAHCGEGFAVPYDKRQLRHCSFECRFWSKVDRRGPEECWPWTGPVHKRGYGKITDDRTTLLAHRVAFSMESGRIKSDLIVDHICNNPICVNPGHLQMITQRRNVMRGKGLAAENARKTHCKNGHPLSGENLVLIRQKNGRNERRCRTCSRETGRRHDAKRRGRRRT